MAGELPIRALPVEEQPFEAPLSDKPTDIALLNTVTPASTTATLAGKQPIEPTHHQEKAAEAPVEEEPRATPSGADIPGGFPITPANELDKFFGVNPLPATAGAVNPVDLAPGEKLPETVAGQNTHSNVKLDKESYEKSDALPSVEGDRSFGVNPLPAAEGALNPITLAPGEKIPQTIAAQNTNSHVKLDKESYEKSDAIPGLETDLPPVSKNMIPESSLPISGFQDNTLSSVGPTSTTAALAGEVPLESHVPEVVRESQQKAHVAPDASNNPLEVQEKAQVEEELKEKVPVAPATSEGVAGTEKPESDISANLAALAATAGGAIIAAGIAIKDTVQDTAIPAASNAAESVQKTAAPYVASATETVQDTAAPYITTAAETAHHDLPESVKQVLPVGAQDAIAERAAQAQEERIEEISPEVPAEVNASIVAARKDPEAAAYTEAVEEKRLVEEELLQHVKPVAAGEQSKDLNLSPAVPAGVKDSFAKSGESPEAAVNTEAVEDKQLVEKELLSEVKQVPANVQSKDDSLAPIVPVVVQDSILESGKNPEAAGYTEAVQEKKAVEQELLSEVKPAPAVDATEGIKSHESNLNTKSESLVPEHSAPVVSHDTPKTAEHAPGFSAYDAVTSQDSEPVTTQHTEALSTQPSTLTTQQTEPALAEPVESKAKEPVKSDEPAEPAVAIPKTEELGAKVPQREVPETTEEPKAKEPVIEQPKSVEPETSAPKTERKTITPVTNIENGSSATDSKATETKPAETAANGGSRENKKKHNRLSSIFSKIKHKLTDK